MKVQSIMSSSQRSLSVLMAAVKKSVLVLNLNGNFQHYEGTLLTFPDHINNRKYLSTQAAMTASGPRISAMFSKQQQTL